MRLNSFTVQGYKNLTAPVTFGPLGDLNVLHGPNNAGKTNLLGAIDLYFRMLGVGTHVNKDQFVSLDTGEQIEGYPFAEVFHAVSPEPIRWEVSFSLEADELRESSIEPECPIDRCVIGLELTPVPSGAQLRVTQFQLGNHDITTGSTPYTGFAQTLRTFIAGTFFLDSPRAVRPYAILDPYRRGAEDAGAGGLVPQRVRDELFDARQSLDWGARSRWTLFVRLMRELESELGPGQFDTAFDRATGRANLVYDAGQSALSIDRLGAGVQRMVALLGSLVLARAHLVGFAEPELGLSPSLQQRLLRATRGVLAEAGGPKQLFFTTHSPLLAGGESAFLLELRDGAPVLEQHAWAMEGLSLSANEGSGATPEDLDSLIGLVDQLAGIEPEELVAAAPAPRAPAAAATPNQAPRGAAPPPAADASGTPSWKWQGKG